jgi:pSer/pThr/pTyr-binding forkhead associated (FHA) protein
MPNVTFQVLDGVDKGRIFRDLVTPVSIGREEGNMVRLNDERVSRFHAKVQQDQSDLIITDLESTNGTRVNGNVIQIRRLRIGDCVTIGRSVLIFGSNEEISARLASMTSTAGTPLVQTGSGVHSASRGPATMRTDAIHSPLDDAGFDLPLESHEEMTVTDEGLFLGKLELPPLPLLLSLSQSARLTEILDFLHRCLARGTENGRANEEGTQIILDYGSWQRVLGVQMLLARYARAVSEPEGGAK